MCVCVIVCEVTVVWSPTPPSWDVEIAKCAVPACESCNGSIRGTAARQLISTLFLSSDAFWVRAWRALWVRPHVCTRISRRSICPSSKYLCSFCVCRDYLVLFAKDVLECDAKIYCGVGVLFFARWFCDLLFSQFVSFYWLRRLHKYITVELIFKKTFLAMQYLSFINNLRFKLF